MVMVRMENGRHDLVIVGRFGRRSSRIKRVAAPTQRFEAVSRDTGASRGRNNLFANTDVGERVREDRWHVAQELAGAIAVCVTRDLAGARLSCRRGGRHADLSGDAALVRARLSEALRGDLGAGVVGARRQTNDQRP